MSEQDLTMVEKIRACLSSLSIEQLVVLRDSADSVSTLAPGLCAWLEHGSSWEIDRRSGRPYPFRGPMEAIAPQEVQQSLDALDHLLVTFGSDKSASHRELVSVLLAVDGLIRVENDATRRRSN
jgi:hypothetical protein